MPLRGSAAPNARCGILGRAIRVLVFKVAALAGDLSLPPLVTAWESGAWKNAGRAEQWLHVTREIEAVDKLLAIFSMPPRAGRGRR